MRTEFVANHCPESTENLQQTQASSDASVTVPDDELVVLWGIGGSDGGAVVTCSSQLTIVRAAL